MNDAQNEKKKYFAFLLIIFFSFSCKRNIKKEDYQRTDSLCNNLYVEVYTTFGSGAFGSDIVDDYLTDSATFRVRIGSYEESSGNIHYSCEHDHVIIEKSRISDSDSLFVFERKIYNTKELMKINNISKSEIETISDKYLYSNK